MQSKKPTYQELEKKVSELQSKLSDQKKTELTAAESELKERQQFLEAIFNNSLNAIMVADDLGNYISVNQAAADMFGYSVEQLLSMNVGDLRTTITPNTAKRYQEYLEKGHEIGEFDFIFNKDQPRIAQYHATRVGENFNLSILSDITEKKQGEEKLKESLIREKDLADIVRNAPLSIAYGYPDGRLSNCNKEFTILTGYSENELKKIDWNKTLTPPKWNEIEASELSKISPGNNSVTYEKEYIHKNGTVVPVELTVTARYDDDANILHFIGFIRDITERKKAEQKEKEAFKLISNAENQAKMGSWNWYPKTNEVQWSDNMCRIYGIEPSEFTPTVSHAIKYTHPDDLDYVNKVTEKFLIEKKAQPPSKYRIITPGNEVKWIELTSYLILDESGEIEEVIGKVQDITDRKKAEENEAKFKAFTEQSSIAVYIANIEGDCIYANKKYLEIAEIELEEALGKGWVNSLHPDDKKDIAEKWYKSVNSNGNWLFEYRFINKKGEITWVEGSAKELLNEENQNIGYLGANIDITDRKKAEQELKESEEKFKNIFNNSVVGKSITKMDGTISANNAFLQLIGYSETELNSMKWQEFTHPDDIENSREIVESLVSGNINTARWEKRYIHKKGHTVWVEISTSLQRDNEGKPEFFITSLVDITERKQMELELIKAKEKAEESEQLKSAFLANMSHEIRTPMNGILGFTNLLSKPNISGEEQQKYIEIIRKSGDRMLKTVNDIIDISKIDAKQVEIIQNNVNINEAIETLFEFFIGETLVKKLELKLINKLPAKSTIVTDKVKLDSIITNLIKNAIKYTDEGEIEIRCYKKDSKLRLEIEDSGIGIPRNRIQSIFNRFEQADIHDFNARQGSGLGLSIAKAYVEMLGGRIWVESEAGKGSTFYFTLPWIEKEPVPERGKERKVANTPGGNLLNILIAEDDDTSAAHLEIVLEGMAKNITRVENGRQAIEHMKSHENIDIILMDVQMPVMNGNEATKRIREFNKDVIIISQTAYAIAGDREKSIKAGCNDYVSKPIDEKILLEKIGKYLA